MIVMENATYWNYTITDIYNYKKYFVVFYILPYSLWHKGNENNGDLSLT